MGTTTDNKIEEEISIEEQIPCSTDDCLNEVSWLVRHSDCDGVYFVCNVCVEEVYRFVRNVANSIGVFFCGNCESPVPIENVSIIAV